MRDQDTIEARIAEAAADKVMERLQPLLQALLDAQPAAPALPTTPPKTDHDGKLFLTVAEAAEILGVHKTTLLRHEFNEHLPPRSSLGAKTGWHRSEIQHFLANLPKRRRLRLGRKGSASVGGVR